MKESKGAKILMKINLEENKFKHFLGFRKKFKRLHIQSHLGKSYMYSFQWTVKVIKTFGKLPVGAWVEIVKTSTVKPTMLEIFKAFENKYGVKVPCVSARYFDIRKDF